MNNIACQLKKHWNSSTRKQKIFGISTGLFLLYFLLPTRQILISTNLAEIERELPIYRARILSNYPSLSESKKQEKNCLH